LNRFRRGALAVSILDAKDHFAAMVTGKKVIEQRGAGAADMEIASWTRRKTSANLCHLGKLTGSGKGVNATWARDKFPNFMVVSGK
jgi:hypothetical protein